jgi:hypothetical protein
VTFSNWCKRTPAGCICFTVSEHAAGYAAGCWPSMLNKTAGLSS